MSETEAIDTGDTVYHRPSKETWLVACVEGENLSWVGWPEGYGSLNDCELKKKATPEERLALLQQFAANPHSHDHRVRYARKQLQTTARPAPAGTNESEAQ